MNIKELIHLGVQSEVFRKTSNLQEGSIDFAVASRTRVIVFLFRKGQDSNPLAVIKVSRNPNQAENFNRYVNICHTFRQQIPDNLRNAVPEMEVLYFDHDNCVVIEQGMTGEPMPTHYSRLNNRETQNYCFGFLDWLRAFQKETPRGKTKLKPGLDLGNYGYSFSKLNHSQLSEIEIPISVCCGDVHPSNQLFIHKRISGVVDWEGVRESELIINDWFQFILSLGIELIKSRQPKLNTVNRSFLICKSILQMSDDWFMELILPPTELFMKSISLEKEYISPLFLYFLKTYYWHEQKEALLEKIFTEI